MANQPGLRDAIREHFDAIAPEYDRFKARSHYYYGQLKSLLAELVPEASTSSVLEIGCGTGALLAALRPARGLGIDISEPMIRQARDRHRNSLELSFAVGEAESLDVPGDWNVIIMVDLIEHLYDPERAIRRISSLMKPGNRLIITWANHLWAPILHALEKLRMKMPEGPHVWEPGSTVESRLRASDLEIVASGTRCLIPAALPGSDWINHRLIGLPGLDRLGLIRFLSAVKR